jgi:uncharacterized protein Smg (DUF494 family)
MKEITDQQSIEATITKLAPDLLEKGFSDLEIGVAATVILQNIVNENYKFREAIDNDAVRILNHNEEYFIPPKIHGYLIQLKTLNIITNTDIELILHSLIQEKEIAITMERAKSLVARLIIKYDTLDYSRNRKFVFNSSSSIN